ncbi:MAG: nucleotidyltransferase family protein [Candidatus Tritonobacter lacicola]|nr:nucleotidyltransferase family protein [Candidatus Tritonobacter lacicola]
MIKPIKSRPFLPLKLREEDIFIIKCLRSEFCRENDGDFANDCISTIDWNVVYERSIQWGVTPLLYKVIRKRPFLYQSSRMSQGFFEKIKMAYLKKFIINEANFKGLTKVLEAFKDAAIKVILLKGVHFAQFIYQDIGIRPMVDIDILIKKEDLNIAEELLIKMGYEHPELSQAAYNFFDVKRDTKGRSDLIERYKTFHHHLYPFRHQKGIKLLEIHWTIKAPHWPFSIDVEGLWRRAKKEEFNGIDVLVLSPEDLLLHISLHTCFNDKLMFHGLRPFCDIAAAINYYSGKVVWEDLQVRAHEWKVDRFLYLALRLSKELIGANVPEKLLHNLKPNPFNEKIAKEAKKRILSLKVARFTKEKIYHPEKFCCDINFSKKISYIFQRIFVSPKELAKIYSLPAFSKRVYFYYFLRLISLLCHYLPLYAKFIFYISIHKKADPFNYNLDTFLNEGVLDNGFD